MSTAAVSSPSIYQELQSFYQSRQADVKQLGSALQSGDLNAAQQAFNTLAALGQNGPFANTEPFAKASRDQEFETIGQDLQAGNLAGAQTAFATLTSKRGNAAAPAATNAGAVVNLTAQAGSTSPPVDNPASICQQLQAYRQQRLADLTQLGQDLKAGNTSAAQQDVSTLTALGQSGPNENGQVFQRADRAQDFQAIGQALQSGDLAGAQSAFASLAGTFGKQVQQALTAISAYNSAGVTGPPVSKPPILLGPSNTPPSTVPPTLLGPPEKLPPSTINLPPSQKLPPSTINLRPSTDTAAAGPEIIINLGGANLAGPNLGGASGGSASNGSATPELVINIQEGNTSSTSPEQVTINLGDGGSGASVSIGETQGNSGQQVTINLNPQGNSEFIVNLLKSSSASLAQSSSSALSVSA